MKKQFTRLEKVSDAFLVLGSQYYSLASYAAEEDLFICGTLYHHALEMLLKGFLSKRIAINELKNIGHDLIKLWEFFKINIPMPNSSRFDPLINCLNKIERIRYPNSIVDDGYILNIRKGGAQPLIINDKTPTYDIAVSDLDEFVETIFSICSVPIAAYFCNTPNGIKRLLPSSFVENKSFH